jgi:hypothetical protein
MWDNRHQHDENASEINMSASYKKKPYKNCLQAQQKIFYSDTIITVNQVNSWSGYGMDDRAIEVQFPVQAKDLSCSLCVQTGSGAHQPPVQWVPGVLSPRLKRGRDVTLTAHPHLVPKSRMSRSYTPLPQASPWRVVGQL